MFHRLANPEPHAERFETRRYPIPTPRPRLIDLVQVRSELSVSSDVTNAYRVKGYLTTSAFKAIKDRSLFHRQTSS
jgi:hypothetical protein